MTVAKAHILVIEDDAILGGAIVQRLALEGFDPVWAKGRAEAIDALKRRRPDFVLSDIVLPDGSGEDVFREAQPYLGNTPILFVTAYGEIDQAVRLVKAGADDYITKPYDADALVERIRQRVAKGSAAADIRPGGDVSPADDAIAAQLRRVAATDLPLLITGETGVGKEVAARFVHAQSARARTTFLAVNCGAVPHDLMESQFFGHERGAFTGATQAHVGFFEEAGEGTLFLDEVGELDARLQAALLRVLQDGQFRPVGSRKDRQFRGRIIAATNADLEQARAERRFRDDLYFRLSVVTIALPPLRERRAEIIPLANRFLQELGPERTFSTAALDAMLAHSWSGNIRELRNRIQRAGVFTEEPAIDAADLFPERRLTASDDDTLADTLRRAEAERIERALIANQGRVADAAKELGISRTTLWKRRGERKP